MTAVQAELLRAVKTLRHHNIGAVYFPANLANGTPKVTGPERNDLGVAAVKLPLQLGQILLELFVLRDGWVVLR